MLSTMFIMYMYVCSQHHPILVLCQCHPYILKHFFPLLVYHNYVSA